VKPSNFKKMWIHALSAAVADAPTRSTRNAIHRPTSSDVSPRELRLLVIALGTTGLPAEEICDAGGSVGANRQK
jgi:hypothetical protein